MLLDKTTDLNVLFCLHALYVKVQNDEKAVDIIENKFLRPPYLKLFFEEASKLTAGDLSPNNDDINVNIQPMKDSINTKVDGNVRNINISVRALVNSVIYVGNYYLNKGTKN